MATLARVWLALAALAGGTVAGFGYEDIRWSATTVGVGVALTGFRRGPALLGLLLLAFGSGALNATLRSPEGALARIASDAPECAVTGRIVEQAGGLGTLASFTTLSCRGHPTVRNAGTAILTRPTADPDARFSGKGRLLPLTDEWFDVARARLGAEAFFDFDAIRLSPPRSAPFRAAAAIRNGLRAATGGLEARRAGLIRGLAIGDTTGLDERTMEAFRRSSLSHLVVVSGSNLAIVIGALAAVTRRLGLHARVAAAAGGLTLFTLVVGPEPSVLRAALMGGIGLAALAGGRRTEPLNILGLALVGLLALRPFLVFSVGLHLSAAATAGIVVWGRSFAERMHLLPGAVATALGATVAAQLAVAPILAGAFGQVSLTGPVANLAAVAAVPPATVLGLLAGLLGAVTPALGAVPARLAEPFGAWILLCGEVFGDPSWTAAEVDPMVGWALGVPVAALTILALRRIGAS
ncbi:MAG: ComEC/Rec2 family competence protein [Actinomycetota bacterium]